MLTYADQRAKDILDLVERVEVEVRMNELFIETGTALKVDQEGTVVATRPIPLPLEENEVAT